MLIAPLHISIVMALICFMLPVLSMGQECQTIKQMAERLKGQRDTEALRYETLKLNIQEKQRFVRALGGKLPSKRPVPTFDESPAKYRDDSKKDIACPEWGNINWGYRKDVREVNIDKYRYYNAFLEEEVDRLDSILFLLNNEPEKPAVSNSPTNPTPTPSANTKQAKNSIATTLPRDIPTSHPQSIKAAQLYSFKEKTYRYCLFDPVMADVRILNRASASAAHGFDVLEQDARSASKDLVFAMNAGMYEPNRQPVGLLISDGQELSPLNQKRGRGNFYMHPNGIFGITNADRAFILTTKTYAERGIAPAQLKLATQSGPVMLINGKINKIFTPNSDNVHVRNAVGIRDDGMVVFAISEQKVSFFELSMFMLELGCTYALYLDGTVSRMYVPYLSQEQDFFGGQNLGPLLYIVE